ncbi:MAG: hypothetical protein ACU0BS_06925 [Hasllibacter sp.]
MRPALTALALTALGAPALADAELTDRYLAASEATRAPLAAMFAACAPGAPALPETIGNEATAAAQTCVVETAIERHGIDYATALVEEAEAFARADLTSLADMAAAVGPVTAEQRSAEIVQGCGVVEASQSSPMGQYMLANMSALMACMQ